MKETKVYVKEMPDICDECPFQNKTTYECVLLPKYNKQPFLQSCPLKSLHEHDREKDKRIKELEQKVQELQEVDNKRAFRLYSVLYNVLERQDPENVASRIEYMTSENYADICEMYKTAKNLKQHDRELVKEVCEKISNHFKTTCYISIDEQNIYDVLDQIQKEFEK